MEYWAFIVVFIGLTILFSEFVMDLETDLFLIIIGIGIATVFVFQYIREKNGMKEPLNDAALIKIHGEEGNLKNQKKDIMQPTDGNITERSSEFRKTKKAIEELKQNRGLDKMKSESDHSRFMPSKKISENKDADN